MGMLPLEYTDCLTDSPFFRESLHSHEKELNRTNLAIKSLVREVKDVINAARSLSKAQRNLADNLTNFKFECIGNSQTDDEIVIGSSLHKIGVYINQVEDERERILDVAHEQFVAPLEDFRKKHIGVAKDGKKKFDKQTAKFCQSQERYLNLSTKKQGNILVEADASVEMEQRAFCKASLEYVFRLQEVQERKKFEFVETLLSFMYGWLTFYHHGHELAKEFRTYMTNIQERVQKTRANFSTAHEKAETLMNKMLEKVHDTGCLNKMYTRQGYLFLMEKKALGTTWTKQYCQYQKESRCFTMMPYTQTVGKIMVTETMTLTSCVRRMSDSIEKRFCFDITADDKFTKPVTYTLQALSEEDRQLWLNAMDGKEPSYSISGGKSPKGEEVHLDETGFSFVQKCIAVLEGRGLEEQGLYRLVGVGSKVNKLLQMGLDKRKIDRMNIDDEMEWECKTITSALKTYFRNLPEPLMTFRLHSAFIMAAKQENQKSRINDVHALTHHLPKENFKMLKILMQHLCNVSANCHKNLMTVANLGVCFGPTLLRQEEETVAAIMEIKFGNIVVEILIENYEQIFTQIPESNEAIRRLVTPAPPPSSALSAKAPYAIATSHAAAFLSVGLGAFEDAVIGMGAKSVSSPGLAGLGGLGGGGTPVHPNTPPVRPSLQPSTVPLTIFNPLGHSSVNGSHNNNSSTESVNSKSSARDANHHTPGIVNSSSRNRLLDHRHGSIGKPPIKDSGLHSALLLQPSCSTTSLPSLNLQSQSRVRTLYHCVGENESELSFEPNQIITNVRPSKEPGWLEGSLNGKMGLVPENYVEYLVT